MDHRSNTSAKAGRPYINELDGFRVLLIFIVSWYHIWQQSWWTPYIGHTSLDFLVRTGYMMVDGTILLSSFLLFMPYAQAMLEGAKLPSARVFYQRRLARILPSYLFVTLAALFAIAIPWGLYSSTKALLQDVAAHLTFTFNFFPNTYLYTNLGVASWTLAVEVQAYLFFPLIARGATKRPASVMLWLTLIGWSWRYVCITQLKDYALVLNQLPAFLDVYALGMGGSLLYVWLRRRLPDERCRSLRELFPQLLATALAVVCFVLLVRLLKLQAMSPDYPSVQRNQMIRRFPLALLMMGIVLSLPFSLRPVRFLFGNKVMRFLASISMNYYLIHQTIAVHLKRIHFPPSVSDTPNYAAEMPWQWQFTFLAFGLSVALAAGITYLIEKPAAKAILRAFAAHTRPDKPSADEALARQIVAEAHIVPGETVWLVIHGVPSAFAALLIREICTAGGEPILSLHDAEIDRALAACCTNEQIARAA